MMVLWFFLMLESLYNLLPITLLLLLIEENVQVLLLFHVKNYKGVLILQMLMLFGTMVLEVDGILTKKLLQILNSTSIFSQDQELMPELFLLL